MEARALKSRACLHVPCWFPDPSSCHRLSLNKASMFMNAKCVLIIMNIEGLIENYHQPAKKRSRLLSKWLGHAIYEPKRDDGL
jgi:hypothetical protein